MDGKKNNSLLVLSTAITVVSIVVTSIAILADSRDLIPSLENKSHFLSEYGFMVRAILLLIIEVALAFVFGYIARFICVILKTGNVELGINSPLSLLLNAPFCLLSAILSFLLVDTFILQHLSDLTEKTFGLTALIFSFIPIWVLKMYVLDMLVEEISTYENAPVLLQTGSMGLVLVLYFFGPIFGN